MKYDIRFSGKYLQDYIYLIENRNIYRTWGEKKCAKFHLAQIRYCYKLVKKAYPKKSGRIRILAKRNEV